MRPLQERFVNYRYAYHLCTLLCLPFVYIYYLKSNVLKRLCSLCGWQKSLFDCIGVRPKQEAHGPQFAHLIKTAIAYLQIPCNILLVLPQQLRHKYDHTIKRSKVILAVF